MTRKEGSGLRTARKVWTMEDFLPLCIEEGECLLWQGGKTARGFPYFYRGSEKVNLRPFIFGVVLGKRIREGFQISVRCGHRECISDKCLVEKSVSKIRKDVHAAMRQDPAQYAKTRNGALAAGLSKLDMTRALEIRASNLSRAELAAAYGVSDRTIYDIKREAIYKTPKVANSIFNLAATMGVS